MAAWSGDLPEEWKSRLRHGKDFPDELVMEPYGLEIEDRAVRKDLKGMAVGWTVVLSVFFLAPWLITTAFGGHAPVSLRSLIYSSAVGDSFLFGLCLGAVVSLWGAAMHRFRNLGDPLVRALDLIWWGRLAQDEGWGETPDEPVADALLQRARVNLLQYALQDKRIWARSGFHESRFVQSWMREQQREREPHESPGGA